VFVFYDGKHDSYSQIIVTMVKHCDEMWERDDDGAQYLFVFSLSGPPGFRNIAKFRLADQFFFVFVNLIYIYIRLNWNQICRHAWAKE